MTVGGSERETRSIYGRLRWLMIDMQHTPADQLEGKMAYWLGRMDELLKMLEDWERDQANRR